MSIYASIKELSNQYHICYNTTQMLVKEMYESEIGGVIYIGRMPRVNIELFEQFLVQRKEKRDELQRKVSD